MERIHLLAREGGLEVAAGYLQPAPGGGWRLHPAAGTRARWLGSPRLVRRADGTTLTLTVTEARPRPQRWLLAREV